MFVVERLLESLRVLALKQVVCFIKRGGALEGGCFWREDNDLLLLSGLVAGLLVSAYQALNTDIGRLVELLIAFHTGIFRINLRSLFRKVCFRFRQRNVARL